MAEADSVDIAAIAQAATPINNRRFMLGILREPRIAAVDVNASATLKFHQGVRARQ
jgi:hypothetical protein